MEGGGDHQQAMVQGDPLGVYHMAEGQTYPGYMVPVQANHSARLTSVMVPAPPHWSTGEREKRG